MGLLQQLDLLDARLVALCGAGGKTTLLYALGREWRRRGAKVALTTNTHIQAELPEGCVLWDRPDEGELLTIWRAGFVPVAGRPLQNGKLQGPSEDMWAILRAQAEHVLVEADGAARKPTKYPAAWEPVIPQYTDRVLVLSGLSALDKLPEEVCFRHELAQSRGLLAKDTPLSEEGLCALLLSGYGRYAPLFLLNQADTPALWNRAERIAAMLKNAGYAALPLRLL